MGVSRRTIMGTIVATSLAGCLENSQNMDSNSTKTEENPSKKNWPPDIAESKENVPDYSSDYRVSIRASATMNWYAAAWTQKLSTQMQEQNQILREIKNELKND